MIELGIIVALALAAFAFADWRNTLVLSLLAALVEGPLRKVTPGEPVAYVLLPAVVFGAGMLGAMVSGMRISPQSIEGWGRYLGLPFLIYVVLTLAQAVNAVISTGQPLVALFGLITYLFPITGIVFAYHYAVRFGLAGVHGFLRAYCVLMTLALSSVFLEAAGVDLAVLGQVGTGLLVTSDAGVFYALSGIFRASEIAAWHAGVSASVLVILAVWRGLLPRRVLVAGLILLVIISASVLTGRRKSLVALLMFATAYVALLAVFARGAGRLALYGAAFAAVAFAGMTLVDDEPAETHVRTDRAVAYEVYLRRQQASFSEIPARFVTLGIAPVEWALNRVGPLGAGIGIGGQGARFLTNSSGIVGGATEGGLGKIVSEVGLPGLAVILWLCFAVVQHVRGVARRTAEVSPSTARLALGIAAILIANTAAFVVATQAFGDPYVLILLGILSGFLLAMPVLAEREAQDVAPSAMPGPHQIAGPPERAAGAVP